MVTKRMYEKGKTHVLLGLVVVLLMFNGVFLAGRNPWLGVLVGISCFIPAFIMNTNYLDYYFDYKRRGVVR